MEAQDERVDKLIDIIIKQSRENTVLLDTVFDLKKELAERETDLSAWIAAATQECERSETTQPFLIS
jgi:hypothetical protein